MVGTQRGSWYVAAIAVVTNIENDHLSSDAELPKLVASFEEFLSKVPQSGTTVIGVDNPLTRSLALFFGKDDMTFTVTSDYSEAAKKTRNYNRFSDMASDMVDVRIYQGIHFRFADIEARKQGRHVA